MRSGCGGTEARALIVALALGAGIGSGAEAGAIAGDEMYSTSGVIEPTRVSGPAVIHFDGVGRDPLGASGPLLLGAFRVEGLTEGFSTHYERTPFSIGLEMDGADPVWLSGELNGTVGGDGEVDVVARFLPTPEVPTDSRPPSGFERWILGTDGVTGILGLPDGGITLGSGPATAVLAQLRPLPLALAPVPEPGPAAVLLAALAGMAWRRRATRRA
jgi:hypothetical protein